MSRVGKAPITIPAGVQVALNGREVSVKGPKGELKHMLPVEIKAAMAENQITFEPSHNASKFSAVWGTSRALVRNMMVGVTEGFSIPLKLVGVGYRANMAGTKLNLSLGYSHPIEMEIPAGITATVNDQTEIIISGTDKQAVGEFAANVRKKRPPEPFKGKGVRYASEHIVMKEGKKK